MCLEPPFLQNTSALDPCKCMALLQKADLEAKCVRPCLAKQIWKENVPNWVLPMSSQGPNQLCLRVGEMEACLGKIASGTNLTWKNYSLARVETFLGCSPEPYGLSPPTPFFRQNFSDAKILWNLDQEKTLPQKGTCTLLLAPGEV